MYLIIDQKYLANICSNNKNIVAHILPIKKIQINFIALTLRKKLCDRRAVKKIPTRMKTQAPLPPGKSNGPCLIVKGKEKGNYY